jgi:hypothetical protein
VSAEWTLAGVSLLHLVKVVVEAAVSCNDVDCGSLLFALTNYSRLQLYAMGWH